MLEPLGLVVKGGVWYLVALSTGDARVFRVSRIRDVRASKGHVVRPARFDLGAFWQQSSTNFVARIPQYVVQVRVHTRLLPVLPHVLGERVRDTIAAARRPIAGWVTMELTFDSSDAACGNLLGLGAGVEVLEPSELRDQLRLQAEDVARLYANSVNDAQPPKRQIGRRRHRRWRIEPLVGSGIAMRLDCRDTSANPPAAARRPPLSKWVMSCPL